MSDIATTSPVSGDELGSFDVKTPDDRTATVEVTGSPTAHARVDIRVENGRRWIFGVNDDVAALVMVLNRHGQRVDDELPGWIEPVIRRTGLEGVEQ